MSRSATDSRDLVISRWLSAPTAALWRAWLILYYSKPGGARNRGIPTSWLLICVLAGLSIP